MEKELADALKDISINLMRINATLDRIANVLEPKRSDYPQIKRR